MDFIATVVIVILTAILSLPLLNSYKRKKAMAKYIDILPGDKSYPVVGTTLKVLMSKREDFWSIIKDRHSKYGPIFRTWMGSIPAVHVYKPEHAQIIFKSTTNISKGNVYKFLMPWLGDGLISARDVPKWRRHRKVITPAFHFKVLDSYVDTFAEKGEHFAKYMDKFSGKGYIEITQYLTRLAVDVISETAMGVKLNFVENEESEYGDAIVGFLKTAFGRIYNPMIHSNFIFNLTKLGRDSKKYLDYIRNFNKQLIEQRKELFEKSKARLTQEDEFGRKTKMSFLDILLAQQGNNNFEYEEIEEEVNTFMFAGQDTTASTICWAFLALGNDPEIQRKVQEELDTIFADDPDRKITPRDLAKMDYLDMVVKEVLRCHCFVPYLGRELVEDVVIDGYHIPKGCTLMISLRDLHHDPNHYPDPLKFDPDRFLPENVAKRHPFAFVPFSAGPRNCLGQKFGMQNTKTLLAYIFRRHTIKCLEKPEDLDYYLEVVLRPQQGLHVTIEPRQKK